MNVYLIIWHIMEHQNPAWPMIMNMRVASCEYSVTCFWNHFSAGSFFLIPEPEPLTIVTIQMILATRY